ncbi:Sulfur carrier protein [Desulfonema limicola]|uniref:Sulfur carrier protein FdhD n=1 Tax=Desulfonema limicola TaxID=45656 RepID=A0A975BDU7_9BACT|nr:formate dehydrogenase accessory sulfurtransferase FdhD [Desulfonema limicola]QTA83435.1 Sulfur carrier protein [Desulfonema limicola]
MNQNTTEKVRHVLQYENGKWKEFTRELIGEEPLLIRVQGRPYSVVMRTLGDEIFHAAGFCLSEGLADRPEDFASIGFCREMDSNAVTVTLVPKRLEKAGHLLERRGFISQTSCGICGKELICDLQQILKPVADTVSISVDQAESCVRQLAETQKLYMETGTSHASMIFNLQFECISAAEDVGRHNALDKAIGRVFMNGKLSEACVAVMSSRISYELVQKAARAQIEVLIGMSYPTALAVELAKSLNMTIACISEKKGFLVFCGQERFGKNG